MALPSASGGQELITNDRDFDVQLVRSALDYVNASRGVGEFVADPEQPLQWVREVVLERYRRAKGIGRVPIKPDWTRSEPVAAQLAVSFMLNSLRRWDRERATGRAAPGEATAFEWVNSMLRDVPMLQYWQISSGKLVLVTVPQLDNALRCVAYAVACIAGNRWDMGGSLATCPFVPASESTPHLFLDYRLDENGKFMRGSPQRFCCLKHSNAFRQRQFKRGRK